MRVIVARELRRGTRVAAAEADAGELNIIPFLDIVTNVMMFLLATIATTFVARVDIPPPSGCCVHRGPPPMELMVKIVREGYIVAAPDGAGFLQPGCTSAGSAAVAVPLRLGQHDTAGLTRCLVAARSAPQWQAGLAQQRHIRVVGNGEIPYRVLTESLDAMRGTRPGARDLFTEPSLGILTN